jgi:hypothetical protein
MVLLSAPAEGAETIAMRVPPGDTFHMHRFPPHSIVYTLPLGTTHSTG